jgi:hypothetical protein
MTERVEKRPLGSMRPSPPSLFLSNVQNVRSARKYEKALGAAFLLNPVLSCAYSRQCSQSASPWSGQPSDAGGETSSAHTETSGRNTVLVYRRRNLRIRTSNSPREWGPLAVPPPPFKEVIRASSSVACAFNVSAFKSKLFYSRNAEIYSPGAAWDETLACPRDEAVRASWIFALLVVSFDSAAAACSASARSFGSAAQASRACTTC